MKLRSGQVALITGASRGLGVYMAKTLAARGINLVLSARSTDAIESLAAELQATGVRTISVTADMSRREDVERLYAKAKQEFGQIDYIINNAGVELISDYTGLTLDEVEWVININLTGPMLLSHLALTDMYARNEGHIVNIASAAGAFPPPFSETYSATKAGLIGFTHSIRLSAQLSGKQVSASVIAPGYMDDAGMYEDMKAVARLAPWYVGSLHAQRLADEVIRVIEKDIPVKLLMPFVPTALKVLQVMIPKTFETVSLKMGIFRTLIDLAKHRSSNAPSS